MTWALGLQAVEAIGIIASLVFAAIAFRRDAIMRGFDSDLKLVTSHREIWSQFFETPALARLMDPSRELQEEPLTVVEEKRNSWALCACTWQASFEDERSVPSPTTMESKGTWKCSSRFQPFGPPGRN